MQWCSTCDFTALCSKLLSFSLLDNFFLFFLLSPCDRVIHSGIKRKQFSHLQVTVYSLIMLPLRKKYILFKSIFQVFFPLFLHSTINSCLTLIIINRTISICNSSKFLLLLHISGGCLKDYELVNDIILLKTLVLYQKMVMASTEEQDRRIVLEFCHLLEKSKQLFNGLRDLPQYGKTIYLLSYMHLCKILWQNDNFFLSTIHFLFLCRSQAVASLFWSNF